MTPPPRHPTAPLKSVGQGMHGTFSTWAKQHLRLRAVELYGPGTERVVRLEVLRFAYGTAPAGSADLWDVVSEARVS